MVETLIALGVFRSLPTRQHLYEVGRYADRIHHLVLCRAGMHVAPLDCNLCICSIEVLILKLTDFTAVHRIGKLAPETLHVEFVRAFSYLLVRIERNAYFSVLDFRMSLQVCHGSYDFRNA